VRRRLAVCAAIAIMSGTLSAGVMLSTSPAPAANISSAAIGAPASWQDEVVPHHAVLLPARTAPTASAQAPVVADHFQIIAAQARELAATQVAAQAATRAAAEEAAEESAERRQAAASSPAPSPAQPAQPAPASGSHSGARWGAWQYALAQQGKWYCWGGAGPSCYDCSGLVMAAYASQGIDLPHNTNAMLGSGKLQSIPESQARPGDLVFMYGGGHVEFVTSWRLPAFGAHSSGERIGFDYWSAVYGFWHVIGSG